MSLQGIPNKGEKSAQMLSHAGIHDEGHLLDLGPVVALLAVRQAGLKPSMNLLSAMAAGLQRRHFTDLTEAEKNSLRSELADLNR